MLPLLIAPGIVALCQVVSLDWVVLFIVTLSWEQ